MHALHLSREGPRPYISVSLISLLILCISTYVPAQTSGKKHADTTATKSQAKKPANSPKTAVGQTAPPRGKDTTVAKSVTPLSPPSKDEEDVDDDDDSTAVTTEGEKAQQVQKGQKQDSTVVKQNPADESASGDEEESDSTATTKTASKHAKAGKKSMKSEDDEESDAAWELETKIDYDTWRIRRAVVKSPGIPSLTPGVILTHESGLSAEFDVMSTLTQPFSFTLWSLILGYEYEFSDWATGTFQYTRYRYTDSGENPEASKFNSWTLMGNFDAQVLEVDITADFYPGSSPAVYLTFDCSKEFDAGDFSFTPTFEASYLDQKLQLILPPPRPPRDFHVRAFAALSLQCPIEWQATDQLSLSFNPQYIRFPISELTSKVRGFASTLTVSYTFDF